MRKLLLFASLTLGMLLNAQQNQLLQADFWKAKPNVADVKEAISKGNSASAFNNSTFDPVALAINNGAPLETIQFLVEQPGNSVDKLTHDGRIYLHWAAMSGNPEIVKYLISKGSDVNKLDAKGMTPLTFAAGFGMNNKDIYEMFFNSGVDAKQKYGNGQTILLSAIAADKDLSLTQYFITKGMSLNDVDKHGSTAFDYAASMGNIDLLKKLQAKGIKATGQSVVNAAQGTRRVSNGIDVFKYLIDDVKVNPKSTNNDGASLISIIARKPNQSEIISYLINKGVDVNATDENGNTALMIAAGGRDLENVKTIVAQTKNINLQNADGESALTQAFKSGTSEIAEFLIDQKADVNVKDIKGNNLAYYIVTDYRPGPPPGSPRPGAQTNTPKKDEFTAKLDLLQSKGVSLKTPQADGNTLLILAASKNDLGLLKKLEAYKIDVNAKNKENMTALHQAALLAKDDQILKYLIALGADKNAKTDFDETAYDLAAENDFLKNNKISIDFLK